MTFTLAINLWAVLLAAIVAFAMGALWYMPFAFGTAAVRLRGLDPASPEATAMPVGAILAEFARCVVTAFFLAQLIAALGATTWLGAVQVALFVWVGFQAVLLAGSVIHENYPWRLYAIHAGDALAKALLIAVILGLRR